MAALTLTFDSKFSAEKFYNFPALLFPYVSTRSLTLRLNLNGSFVARATGIDLFGILLNRRFGIHKCLQHGCKASASHYRNGTQIRILCNTFP